MNTHTVNITQLDLEDMRSWDLGELQHFITKKQAECYAKENGWFKTDVRRIHARLHGYMWIIIDSHGNAIAQESFDL